MRILHISSAKNFGGGERHLVDLCRGLDGRGHEVFVALRPTNEWQHRLDFLSSERIFHLSIRNSFGVLSAIKLAEFARQNEIDVIHAHVARDYIPSSIACLAAKPVKFVLTRHVLFPLKAFNRFALSNLSMAIGVSEAVGKELRRVFPPAKVTVIKNGIDVSARLVDDALRLRKEFREFHSIPVDALLVGSLGELKELKGQRDLILAAAEILKEFPETNFVIVGRDNSRDKSFRRELRRLAGVLGIDAKILWLDWLDDTDAFYSAIDMYVSPSHSESFGLALLEAMANGKAVAATATEGARELLGDQDGLAQIADPVSLAESVKIFLRSSESRDAAGSENRELAAHHFPLDSMIESTERLYRKVLGRKRYAAHE